MTRLKVLVALLAAGCGAGAPEPGELRSVGYAALACYGTCPVYQVTIHPDGTGIYVGESRVRVTGSRRIRVSPETWRAVAARMGPYRPVGIDRVEDGSPRCGRGPIESLGGIRLVWTSERRTDQLAVMRGCSNAEAARMVRDLEAIPAMLPIADLVGSQP